MDKWNMAPSVKTMHLLPGMDGEKKDWSILQMFLPVQTRKGKSVLTPMLGVGQEDEFHHLHSEVSTILQKVIFYHLI